MKIVLYTTVGCHLCEKAEAMLASVAPNLPLEKVDIAEDDALIEQYGERIPVLAYKGEELGWPFGILDVQRLIKNKL